LGTWIEGGLIHVDPVQPADFIVVLGGDMERAVEAARLYRDGAAPEVICSSRGADADHLARVAAAYGVPSERIVIDRAAIRTHSHPATVAALPGVDKAASRLIVVTSPLHTARARACFMSQGFAHVGMYSPGWRVAGDLEPAKRSFFSRAANLPAMLYEVLAWGFYGLRGWL